MPAEVERVTRRRANRESVVPMRFSRQPHPFALGTHREIVPFFAFLFPVPPHHFPGHRGTSERESEQPRGRGSKLEQVHLEESKQAFCPDSGVGQSGT